MPRRRETERLLVGLEVLPRKILHYRGRPFPEMDLDALLVRKPQLAPVDELAHTNIEGAATPSDGTTSRSCSQPASTSTQR